MAELAHSGVWSLYAVFGVALDLAPACELNLAPSQLFEQAVACSVHVGDNLYFHSPSSQSDNCFIKLPSWKQQQQQSR